MKEGLHNPGTSIAISILLPFYYCAVILSAAQKTISIQKSYGIRTTVTLCFQNIVAN